MSQFEDDGPEEEPIEFAIHRANSVSTVCSVIRFLREQKFHEKYMGSGIMITLQKMNGELLCPQVLVPGEDMRLIKAPIVDSLVGSLTLKRSLLRRDLADIEKTVPENQ